MVNGTAATVEADPQTPLLWVLRDELNLPGTKFGCGIAMCGACTVHVNGQATRSCVTPVSAVEGEAITTIEGISATASADQPEEKTLHKVQKAWLELQVPQCGYCQSGQIMSAVALLDEKPDPSDEDIDAAMSGNVCRCGMYGRIRKAIKLAAAS